MKLKYFLFLLLAEHLTFNITYATVRYVSTTGSSTPPYTSWETASDSIQKCINICNFGDTVYVANGVYKENLVINTAISLIGSSMDSTVIDGTGLADLTIVVNTNIFISNFHICGKGFNLTNSCIIWATVQNSIINVSKCKMGESSTGIGCVSATLFASDLVMYSLFKGFVLLSSLNNDYNIKRCNIVLSDEGSRCIDVGYAANSNFFIYNNIMLSDAIYGSYYGIYLGAIKRIHLFNNVIGRFLVNINFGDIIDTAFIYNNLSLYKGSRGLSGDGSIYTENDLTVIKNNIFKENDDSAVRGFPPYVNLDYNLFWENQNDLYGLSYGDSDIVADPMFVKDTIPTSNGNYDFHLQKYSPAIDKGDPNILDLDGSRSDIGMYGGPFGETYTYQDLAPLAPRNLSAIVDSNYILVKWNKNTEADTAYYKVYRDTVSGFTIDSTKLVSSPKDTFFVQVKPHNIRRYVYKVTCVDKQGNESKPSEELIVNITSVSMNGYPMIVSDYILYQNYPNPFNPSTKIGYQLKSGGYVKLMVYDIKGELVSVLVNKEQNAGYYEVEFNVGNGLLSVPDIPGLASGIYLYRIEVIGAGRIPVYTEMKKMLLIK